MDLFEIARWAEKHLGGIGHEQRVVRISSTLFDLTRGLHGLSPADRRVLRAGALVHDVGRSVDKAKHPEVGAGMILRSRSLRLSESDRRGLAYLTMYHRDEVPALGEDEILEEGDDGRSLRTILALLRTADALDSRSLETPKLVFGLKRKKLKITCVLREATGKARRVYERRKKYLLLEEELGCEVEVEVKEGRALKWVA
jgi:exopolyphosphatase/guanosine-5'-triphosphate,3'-diphosphate pyrophosphatase